MTAPANGYECMECGEVERDGIGEADVACICGSTNTIQRRITDCDVEACDDDAHDFRADWHVEEAPER